MLRAYFHRRRCAASHQRRGASIRSALCSLLFQVVDESLERVKAYYLGAVGNEVGQRIDVVKIELAIAIVSDVFNTAHFNVCGGHNSLHRVNDVVRGRVALYAQAGLRRVNGAGGALEFLAAGGLADVGGAEVKRFSRDVDFNAVEILAADNLYANDVAVASRDEFLHQSCVIEAEVERVCV